MIVEHYQDKYFQDVKELVKDFHKEYLTSFYEKIEDDSVKKTITLFIGEKSKNAFLLIVDGKCEGIFAGVEVNSNLNTQRVFQEIIWYVRKPHGHLGIPLVGYAEEILKSYGFSMMIMAVLENEKSDRIKRIYSQIGYKLLETHFVKLI